MKLPMEIPPLIITRDTQFIISDTNCDAHIWLTPQNMRNANAFVIYDPDGSLHKRYANTLYHDYKYNIKVLNLANVKLSTRYSPFAYIRDDNDVAKLASALVTGTEGMGKPGDINFLSAEKMLLTALIGLIHDDAADHERNINMINEVLKNMEIQKDDEGNRYKHAIDFLIEDKEAEEPENLSVRLYNLFDELTWDEQKYVIDSCIKRLSPFNTDEIIDFSSSDELCLDNLNFPNTALFVIAGNNGAPLNFIASLMYSQLFDVLYEKSVQ